MHVLIVGLNHRTAVVDLRENFSFSEGALDKCYDILLGTKGIRECMILSTCNRVEIYAYVTEVEGATRTILDFMVDHSGIEKQMLTSHLYILNDAEAISHLFRVAAGLDSMIIGEPQITGQVREAYERASLLGATSTFFNCLFRMTAEVAKKVRSETEIGKGSVSVGCAAVQLARDFFTDFKDLRILVLGTGEMSTAVTKNLFMLGVKDITVVSRTVERARELAVFVHGKPMDLKNALAHLIDFDIIISATASPHPVITKKDMALSMKHRHNRPVFIIDIAVPRDVEKGINDLSHVTLYNIDDLQAMVAENYGKRKIEAGKAESIIKLKTQEFMTWHHSREVIPTIVLLRKKFDHVRRMELEQLSYRHSELVRDEEKIIHKVTESYMNKLLHGPITVLKKLSINGKGKEAIDMIRQLYELDEEVSDDNSECVL